MSGENLWASNRYFNASAIAWRSYKHCCRALEIQMTPPRYWASMDITMISWTKQSNVGLDRSSQQVSKEKPASCLRLPHMMSGCTFGSRVHSRVPSSSWRVRKEQEEQNMHGERRVAGNALTMFFGRGYYPVSGRWRRFPCLETR